MAVKANLLIDQGSDFSASIELEGTDGNPVDLTSFTANAQMRKNYTSSVAVTFDTTTTANTGIVMLGLSNTQTAAIEPGRYLYDVEIVSDTGIITRVVEGIVTVTPSMTRT